VKSLSDTITDLNQLRHRGASMKPQPAPNVPGNTDAERMSNALTKVLTVSKADLLKQEAKWKRARAKRAEKGIQLNFGRKPVRFKSSEPSGNRPSGGLRSET
jgi:hypothetical protein